MSRCTRSITSVIHRFIPSRKKNNREDKFVSQSTVNGIISIPRMVQHILPLSLLWSSTYCCYQLFAVCARSSVHVWTLNKLWLKHHYLEWIFYMLTVEPSFRIFFPFFLICSNAISNTQTINFISFYVKVLQKKMYSHFFSVFAPHFSMHTHLRQYL